MFNVKLLEKKLREKNLMQKELAEKLELNKAAITEWKKGVYPKATTLIKLCELLDVSADELLNIPRKTNISNEEDDDEEIKLLNNYREADKRGKENIMKISEIEAVRGHPEEIAIQYKGEKM